MNYSIHKDMSYASGYELYIRLAYYELDFRLIQHELYITGFFGFVTQENTCATKYSFKISRTAIVSAVGFVLLVGVRLVFEL